MSFVGPRSQQGFSLIELMAVVSISAIIALGAGPLLAKQGAQDYRDAQLRFAQSLNKARDTALELGERVELCTSANGSTCDAGPWSQGWIVFVAASDGTASRVLDSYVPDVSGWQMHVTSSHRDSLDRIGFNGQGYSVSSGRLITHFCSGRNKEQMDIWAIERTGRFGPVEVNHSSKPSQAARACLS